MITVEDLSGNPHPHLARARATAPVVWIPDLGAWLVTGRDAAIEVMRDASRFTVDDPRFSTGRVVGPSMLSTDGEVHARHRAAFATALRPAQTRDRLEAVVADMARAFVAEATSGESVDLRAAVAGPVAASVAIQALGLVDASVADVLGWYTDIAAAVSALSVDLDAIADDRLMDGVRVSVARTVADPTTTLATARGIGRELTDAEFASNVAIILFGALETSEAMMANLLRTVVADATLADRLRGDSSLRDRAVDESLRLEPGATFLDRYAVGESMLARAAISERDHVIVSLAGANRDPDHYADPDRFSLDRDAEPPQLAFATGPHGCLGAHLARMEARAVLDAWLDFGEDWRPQREGFETATGLVFRKPARLMVERPPRATDEG